MNKRRAKEQLAYQAKLLALVNDAIVASDEDYTITTWNAAAEAQYGWKAEEVIGRPGLDITRTDFGTNKDEMLQKIAQQDAWRGEVTQARKDGTRFPVEVTTTVLRDETGKISGYVSVNRDITERKHAEEMRNLHLTVMETVAEGIYLIGFEDNLIKWANRKCEELFGYDPGEMIGMQIDKVNAPTEKTPTETRISIVDVLRQTGEWHGEITNIKKDGTYFWCKAHVRLFDHPEFGTVGISVHTDITERKLAEEALRESKEQLALILESAAEGIYGLDLQGKCTFCNSAALRLLGYREEQELLGNNLHDLAHHTRGDGTPYPREQCLVTRVFASGESVHSDRESLWRSDGGSFPAEYWAHPMYRDGKLTGAVVTFIDRTEHAAMEQQLLQAHKLEAVGQLAAGVAHDFNNILSSIIGHGHLTLLKLAKDDPARLNVESMLEASYQASRLVQSLLMVGRQQLTSRKPLDLNDVVAGATKLLARTVAPGVELKTACGDEPLPVLVDAGQIELVLQNLAANAVAAMPGGGALTIATQRIMMDEKFIAAHGFGRPGRCALLSVSDTGAGMDEQTQKRIFEPFFSKKQFVKNTGLGLAVAYGIVKQHDGHITVSSRPGAGTTFSIYLPLHDVTGEGKRKISPLRSL